MANLDMYRTLTPQETGASTPGQIYWIAGYHTMDSHYVLRIPDTWNKVGTPPIEIHQRVLRNPQANSNDLFNHMPYPDLRVRQKEELFVKKAKGRPAVLISMQGYNSRNLANQMDRANLTVQPNSGLFAPITSLKKEDNRPDYPQSFIDRCKDGQFPGLLHLPNEGNIIITESMMVLTELQWHEKKLVEATNLALDPLYLADALDTFYEKIQSELLK